MRVPTIEESAARTSGLAGYSPLQRQQNNAISNAIGQFVDTAVSLGGEFASKIQAEAEAEKKSANATADALNTIELQKLDTSLWDGHSNGSIDKAFNGNDEDFTPGFRLTQGLQASAQSQKAIEEFEKGSNLIASKITDPEQRARFEVTRQHFLQSFANRVERHTGQQLQRAKVATADALTDSMLKGVGADPDDPGNGIRIAKALNYVEQIGLSPEWVENAKQNIKAKVALTAITSKLANDDVEGAQAIYDDKREVIGDDEKQVKAAINSKRKALEGERLKHETNQTVANIIGEVRKEDTQDGFIDRNKAMGKLAEIADKDPDKAKAVASELSKQLTLEDARKREVIKGWENQALGMFMHGGYSKIDSGLVDRIARQPGGNKFLMDLQTREATELRRLRARSSGRGSAAAKAMAKEEALADKLAVLAFKGLSDADQASADTETFITTAPRISGRPVTDAGKLGIEALRRQAQNRIDKGFTHDTETFTSGMTAELKKVWPKKKKWDASVEDGVKAMALTAYQEELDKHPERPPSLAEKSAIFADLATKAVGGTLLDDGQETGVLGPTGKVVVTPHLHQPKAPEGPYSKPTRIRQVKQKGTGKMFWLMSNGTTEEVK